MTRYYLKGAEAPLGPFDLEELGTKQITREALIQIEGHEEWTPAGEINTLAGIFDAPSTRAAGPHWGSFKKDHCVGNGLRQYSSILLDIPWGQSWENTAQVTPAVVNGVYFPRPTRYVNNLINLWGEFDVPDNSCGVASPGTGNAIVFVNRNITLNNNWLGHTGWAFKLPNGNFMYGSKEATPTEFAGYFPGTIPAGKPNGVFIREGSFDSMIAEMKAGGNIGQGPKYVYHQYKVFNVAAPHVNEAIKMAQDSKGWGYGLLGNNCMDDTYRILNAYAGGSVLPKPPENWFPNIWFDAIKAEQHILNPIN